VGSLAACLAAAGTLCAEQQVHACHGRTHAVLTVCGTSDVALPGRPSAAAAAAAREVQFRVLAAAPRRSKAAVNALTELQQRRNR
jgi:hypothetical protein